MASIKRAKEMVGVIDSLWREYGRGDVLDEESLRRLNEFAEDTTKHHLLGYWLEVDLVDICLKQKLRREQDDLFSKLYWGLVSSGFWKEFYLIALKDKYEKLQERIKIRGNWKNTVNRMVVRDEVHRVAGLIEYAFSKNDLKELALIYKDTTSRDKRTAIESLLTTCNFHSVVGDFSEGRFLKYICKEAEF